MPEPVVTREQQQGLVWLRFARPERFNAFTREVATELLEHLLFLANDATARVVIITGAGEVFSAGGDIKSAVEHPQGADAAFYELATKVHLCITEIRRFPKPVIAAINGTAAGGGFSLALACDFRVIAATARLKQAFTSNALCLDGGGTWLLPRLVGLSRAMEIAMLDDWISAEQALAWGLVHRVASAEDFPEAVTALAERLAERSQHTFQVVKTLLNDSWNTPLETQLERERQGLVQCVRHPDGVEGLQAFLEKRPPRFP